MQRAVFILFLGITGLVCIPKDTLAQAKIVFRINLEQQMKDSVFVPDHNDRIFISGDQLPLSPYRKVRLEDQEPADSVYSVTVNFPYLSMGKTLKYSYKIKNSDGIKKEFRSRFLLLKKTRKQLLDVAYFNAFPR